MTIHRRRGRPPHDDVLTKTEWSIVHAVQHGMTTREIAKRRGVSFDAVKFHIDNAMAKLGMPNRQALRRWFRTPRGSALSAQASQGSTTCAGVRLYLFQGEGEPPPQSIIYFGVPDIQDAYDALRARGVDFINPPHFIHRHADGTEEWMAFFKDPEGRPLAIMSKVTL